MLELISLHFSFSKCFFIVPLSTSLGHNDRREQGHNKIAYFETNNGKTPTRYAERYCRNSIYIYGNLLPNRLSTSSNKIVSANKLNTGSLPKDLY